MVLRRPSHPVPVHLTSQAHTLFTSFRCSTSVDRESEGGGSPPTFPQNSGNPRIGRPPRGAEIVGRDPRFLDGGLIPRGAGDAMPRSVLLVDDNPHFLQSLDRFLAVHGEAGAQVVGTVVGGRDAVGRAARLRPDVILVDLKTPDISGIELLPQLRRALPNAILIVLSLTEPAECEEGARAAGADAFVSTARLECDLIPTIQRFASRAPRRDRPPQGG